MSRRVAIFLLFFASITFGRTALRADELALTGAGVGVAQMQTVLAEASDQGLWVSQLKVQLRGNRIVYDYVLEKNTEETPWFARLNATDAMLVQVEQTFADLDYTRFIDQSVLLNGRVFSSVVWRKISVPQPLILPSETLPQSGMVDEGTQEIDAAVCRFLVEHNVVGATVAVGVRGRLIYSRGFGYANIGERQPMQPNTEMRIASISKVITATAVLRLIQAKRLSLDAKVLPFLDAVGFRIPDGIDERWRRVCVGHLLQHRGGWDRDVSGDPMFKAGLMTRVEKLRQPATCRDVIQYQLSKPLDFAPGDRRAYSNFGYLLLGPVVESVCQANYETSVRDLLLRPAGMMATRIGKTRIEDRGEREALYYMQNTTTHRPCWSFSSRSTRRLIPQVPAPYGRWDVQLLAAAAGWVSTAPDLVRLSSMIQLPKQGMPLNFAANMASGQSIVSDFEACQLGALAGTSSLLLRRSGDVVCCVLFNTDESIHGGAVADLFLPVICEALDRVEDWPVTDLFANKENSARSY